MLELIKIHIKNLASIEDQTYYFGTTLNTIIGINKDTSNVDKNISNKELLKLPLINLKSNGSGKTTIIEALHICLLGSCIKEKVTTKQLIRDGEESMKLELICKNTEIGLSKIRIVREIFANKNKTSKLSIYEQREGEEEIEIPKSTSDNMDTYILDKFIGLSKDDIDNFFIIQKDKFKSFLLLPDQKKKEILSRFTGISNFGYIEESLTQEVKELESNKIEIDKEISKYQGKIESYNEIINNSLNEEEFESTKKEKIKIVELKIDEEKEDIKSIKNKIEKEKLNIDKLKQVLSVWEGRKNKYLKYIKEHDIKEQLDDFNQEKQDVELEITEIKEAIDEATSLKKDKQKSFDKIEVLLNKLETLLDNLIECPNCKFKFNPKDNSSKEDFETKILQNGQKSRHFDKEIKEIDADIKEINGILKDKEKELSSIDAKIKVLKNRNKRIKNIGDYIEERIQKISSQINFVTYDKQKLESSIKQRETHIKELLEQIEKIKQEKYSSVAKDLDKYKKLIESSNKSIEEFNKDKEELDIQIQLAKDSSLNYGLFKNYLYNKIIAEIEYIVNNYLNNFSDLSVSIQGNRTLADGKSIRDEINCLITRNNKEISYFLLSSGEKAFIDIAFILAFQKILNISSHNGFNFLILDEITGTIDCSNQEELLKAISVLNKPMLFITHIPTISDFKTTYIIKENNKSIIIQ